MTGEGVELIRAGVEEEEMLQFKSAALPQEPGEWYWKWYWKQHWKWCQQSLYGGTTLPADTPAAARAKYPPAGPIAGSSR